MSTVNISEDESIAKAEEIVVSKDMLLSPLDSICATAVLHDQDQALQAGIVEKQHLDNSFSAMSRETYGKGSSLSIPCGDVEQLEDLTPTTPHALLHMMNLASQSSDKVETAGIETFVLQMYRLEQDPDGVNCDSMGEDIFTALVSDGTKSCVAHVLHPTQELKSSRECTISISGYIFGFSPRSSTALEINHGIAIPREEQSEQGLVSSHLYVTCYHVLSRERTHQHKTRKHEWDDDQESIIPAHFRLPPVLSSWKSQRGGILDWITAKKLDFRAVASRVFREDNKNKETELDAIAISSVLQQHAAIASMYVTSWSTPSSKALFTACGEHAEQLVQLRTSSVNVFDRQQLEKETDSILLPSTESWYPSKMSQVQMQFQQTLEYSLICKDEPLSSDLIVRWHLWLMGDDVDPEAGSFRSVSSANAMRAPDDIERRLLDLCNLVEAIWLPQIRDDTSIEACKKIATFAALVYVGIIDVFPFRQGNDILARIAVNWALRRCGFPCCIVVSGSERERQNSIASLETARKNICLGRWGDLCFQDIARVLDYTGGLSPLVEYLLGRMACALDGLTAVMNDKARWAADERSARLSRRARETAAETFCIICLEHDPNIATLCCGKPVHFNCLGNWLIQNPTCPQCRSDLPNLNTTSSASFEGQMTHNNGGDDSEVERLLNYISQESLESSSSDSSSTSSSSDSSSDSSSWGGFSRAQYIANFVSSDEDVSDSDYESQSDDDSEDQHFFNADLAPLDDVGFAIFNGSMGDQFIYEEDAGVASGGPQHPLRDEPRHEETPSGITPRLTFLDPSLLVNVDTGDVVGDDTGEPTLVGSSSAREGDQDNSQPSFAHPSTSRTITTHASPVISPLGNELEHRLSAGDFSNSIDYELEAFGGDSFFDPPVLCAQPRCQNHAAIDCISKRCYSCCVKSGVGCAVLCRSSEHISSTPLDYT